MATTTKYNTVIGALGLPMPSWVTDADDAVRVAAYDGYDDMYKNTPGTFAVSMRGAEDRPIYVPGASRIVEAVNRYLGQDWQWAVTSLNPDAQSGAAQQLEVQGLLHNLYVREEMRSKLYSLKRNMVKRGDALWHVSANEALLPGMRLSINEIHPRTYFRIYDPSNIEVLSGCYIVDLQYADDGTTQIARRQEYRYTEAGTVFTRVTYWEPNAWDDRFMGHPALKTAPVPTAVKQNPAMSALLSGFELPPSVRTIPVYHIRNQREGGEPFGTSQVSGIETLIAAINQTVSDEDITLALQGIGVYMTDSAPPRNADGEEVDWEISPGAVMEVKTGTTFERISGVTSVVPFQDHLSYLGDARDQSAGLSAVAVGKVDVAVAQSGVALRLEMAPILSGNAEKEVELLSRLDHFVFDLLTMWFPVDGTTVPPGLIVVNSFGDPLPVDRAAVLAEVVLAVTNGLMSREFAINYLSVKLGFDFPVDMLTAILAESAGAAAADPDADRLAADAVSDADALA